MSLPFSVLYLFLYGLAGIAAGLLSGLMGIGGGIVVVPALIFLFNQHLNILPALIMPLAAGTSLAVMVCTSLAAVLMHRQKGQVLWKVFYGLLPGISFGVFLGSLLSNFLPTTFLLFLLSLFLLLTAYRMVKNKNRSKIEGSFPGFWRHMLLSSIAGLISGLLGIGGGTIIIPYLFHCGIEIRKISPISGLCTLTAGIIGTVLYVSMGMFYTGLPEFSTGFVYWPAVLAVTVTSILFAPLGVYLNYRLPTRHLAFIFAGILTVIGVQLMIKAAWSALH